MSLQEGDSGNDDAWESDISSEGGDWIDETELEMYETPLDKDDAEINEFILFKETIKRKHHHKTFYHW